MEYGHLALKEWTVIYMQEGRGLAAVAQYLGWAHSTIRRELARHPKPYDAGDAHVRAMKVRRRR